MPRTTKIINMSLPLELYAQIEDIARKRRVPRSQLLKEALKVYITEEKRWEQIRKWGRETKKRLQISEEDVERIREEYWKESQKENG